MGGTIPDSSTCQMNLTYRLIDDITARSILILFLRNIALRLMFPSSLILNKLCID